MAGRALVTVAVLVLAVLVVLVAAPGFVSDLPISGLTENVDADNPYRESDLIVGIEANGSRAFEPLVGEAATYWERNAERYAGYPVTISVTPDAPDPDIEVTFTQNLRKCGRAEHAAGCSPKITRALQTVGVVDVRVLDDLSNNSTVRVLRHEFGHALGLGHDDAPRSLMKGRAPLDRLDEPDGSGEPREPDESDAGTRAIPWTDPTLTVAVDRSGVPDGEWNATDEQLADALGYYARGANGRVPRTVSLRRIANASAADVTIRFGTNDSCGPESASCGHIEGTDADGDGNLETHTSLTITLADVDTSTVGWHVAHWLGRGLGLEDTQLAPALRANASDTTRWGAWQTS